MTFGRPANEVGDPKPPWIPPRRAPYAVDGVPLVKGLLSSMIVPCVVSAAKGFVENPEMLFVPEIRPATAVSAGSNNGEDELACPSVPASNRAFVT